MKKLFLKQAVLVAFLGAGCSKTNHAGSVAIEPQETEALMLSGKSLSLSNVDLEVLSALDGVVKASFTLQNKKLRLKLLNSSDDKIQIPPTLLTKAKFKVTANFILVNLGNASVSTSLVIDKQAPYRVFLTKDTDLNLLDIANTSDVYMDEIGQNVLKLKARLESGSLVTVGLVKSGISLNAYKF